MTCLIHIPNKSKDTPPTRVHRTLKSIGLFQFRQESQIPRIMARISILDATGLPQTFSLPGLETVTAYRRLGRSWRASWWDLGPLNLCPGMCYQPNCPLLSISLCEASLLNLHRGGNRRRQRGSFSKWGTTCRLQLLPSNSRKCPRGNCPVLFRWEWLSSLCI